MLLSEIARQLSLPLKGEDCEITGLNSLADAGPGELSFLANPKYVPQLSETHASAVIVRPEFIESVPCALVSEEPYADFGRALSLFSSAPAVFDGVSEQAFVHPAAEVGESTGVFPFAYISAGARIGKNCQIYPGCFVGENCSIGDNTVLFPNVAIMPGTAIGKNCILHAGVVIGADGFGFARAGGGIQKIPQVGRVSIGDNVEIGANSTVDRAVLGVTRIGNDTKIDNLVQIGHNVEIGERCLIVAMVGVAGSTKVGDEVTIAGHTGIAGHLKIGNKATVGPFTAVPKNVAEHTTVGGIPAMDGGTYLRWVTVMPKLPDMLKRLNALEKELAKIKSECAGN
jgi:UDP-3-O-[3-hydroxymyristoyl] glucosamine N-acyltransferase